MSLRARQTAARRREILDAALACFSERGFEKTTVEDIRGRSGASNGSLYHHFGSKERIAASLYVEAIESALGFAVERMRGETEARDGIRALAGAYVLWLEAAPELARFALRHRGAGFLDAARDELARVNARVEEAVLAWMRPHLASGAIPVLHPTLYWGILMGPSDHVARQWAERPGTVDVHGWERILGDAAWSGLLAAAEASA